MDHILPGAYSSHVAVKSKRQVSFSQPSALALEVSMAVYLANLLMLLIQV